MSKSIKITVLVIFIAGINAAFAKLRTIAAPTITNSEALFISAGSNFNLEGSGFIANFTKAHKVIAKKKGSKKKIRLKTIASSETQITVNTPEDLELGDYNLYIYLKTRFFKSKKQRLRNFIRIRPQAPAQAKLKFTAIKNPNELSLVTDNERLILDIEGGLKTGKNLVRTFYYQDGYKSLLSSPVELYYLKEGFFDPRLSINSENPINSYAKTIEEDSLDVSEITKKTQKELTRTYHIQTPTDPMYLATQIKLSPVYIKEAHVKSPECLILKNRSSGSFSLENCHINDAISTRYQFKLEDSINPKEEFKLEAKLSLNDSGDSIELVCNDEIIDEISYTAVTAGGFAIAN